MHEELCNYELDLVKKDRQTNRMSKISKLFKSRPDIPQRHMPISCHAHFVMTINSTRITISTMIVVILQLSLAFLATLPNLFLALSNCD